MTVHSDTIPDEQNWRAINPEKIFKHFGVDLAEGLSSSTAELRLKETGPNKLPERPTPALVALFFKQFKNPLIGILIIAALALVLFEHVSDAAVIFVVLILNSAIGTFHETRAHKQIRALKKLTPQKTIVRRDGKTQIIDATLIVAGDIILLHEGDRVVADARLISTHFLRVNESLLTGESMPVTKDEHAKIKPNASSLEAPTMVFAGTSITHGTAEAIVTATGARSELGKISASISESRTPVPLARDIHALSRVVILVVLGFVGIIAALAWRTELTLAEIAFTSVAIATSAIPEGLPIVLTIVLSTGAWRMAKRQALVKRLYAVEALGSAHILALDKTGTITRNEMTVTEMASADDIVRISPYGDGAYRNNIFFKRIATFLPHLSHARIIGDGTNKKIAGDPTEAALLTAAHAFEVSHETITTTNKQTWPFDYEEKFSAAKWSEDDHDRIVIAGAPEVILAACDRVDRNALSARLEEMAGRGLRVVAIAERRIARGAWNRHLAGFTFLAFIGMMDAIRPEARTAIERIKAAGLKTIMITGDLPTTARAVAREVGIFETGDHIITGNDLRRLHENELRALLPRASVFARVSPEDKLRIIELYQKTGQTIAMTGDGVNDAPSLVASHLGIAMGAAGTDVAREAADIILLNDNLESIVAAIDEGRTMYRTLHKVLVYLFSTNFGEICVLAASLALTLPLPILPVQIIWLNLVTDGFLDVSLAMEPKDAGSSVPHTRRGKYLIHSADATTFVWSGILMTVGTLWMFLRHTEYDLSGRRTIALIVLAVFQWFHAWSLRTERASFFKTKILKNPYLVVSTCIIIVLQVAAVYAKPLQNILHTQSVDFMIWIEAIIVASSIFWVDEIRKYFKRHA